MKPAKNLACIYYSSTHLVDTNDCKLDCAIDVCAFVYYSASSNVNNVNTLYSKHFAMDSCITSVVFHYFCQLSEVDMKRINRCQSAPNFALRADPHDTRYCLQC